MDRGAWPATVHEVERGGTRLSDYHTHKHGHGDGCSPLCVLLFPAPWLSASLGWALGDSWRCREEGTGEHGPDQAVRGWAEARGPPDPLLLSSGNSAATSRPGRLGARHQFACASILSLQPRWKPRPRPQLGGGRGAGRAAQGVLARAPAPGQPQPIAGRSRRPLSGGRSSLCSGPGAERCIPESAGPAAARQVEDAAQREACASARVFMCVSGVCVYGCIAGQRVPCDHESVGVGVHTPPPGRKEVSAGFEAPGWMGEDRLGSAPAPGALPTPIRDEGRLPTAPGCSGAVFLVHTSWGVSSRGLTGSSPPLPQDSLSYPFPDLHPFNSTTPPGCFPIPRPWPLGKRGKAKAGSLPDPLVRLNRGLFPGLQGLGVCVRGPGRQAELGENGSCASQIMLPSFRVGSRRRPTRVPEVKQDG